MVNVGNWFNASEMALRIQLVINISCLFSFQVLGREVSSEAQTANGRGDRGGPYNKQ